MRDTKELTKLMDKHDLHIGNREDEFVAEYESALKNLVENGSKLEL